jgi:hypothetical protein
LNIQLLKSDVVIRYSGFDHSPFAIAQKNRFQIFASKSGPSADDLRAIFKTNVQSELALFSHSLINLARDGSS